MTVASGFFLILGIICYGIAGANLHAGANSATGALRSRAFWLGTALQAAGFLSMLVARVSLPLLLVQACASAGLVVTAALQHATGVRRLRLVDVLAVAGVVAGLGAIATSTTPGPAVTIAPAHLWLLLGLAAVGSLAMIPRLDALASGLLSGLGFSLGAIAARLVIGDHTHPVWYFWRLPWQNWLCGVLTVIGIVIGQVHLTRGLRGSHAAPVLGAMYLTATVVPTIVGWTMMHELPRAGMIPVAVVGLLVAGAGVARLLKIT